MLGWRTAKIGKCCLGAELLRPVKGVDVVTDAFIVDDRVRSDMPRWLEMKTHLSKGRIRCCRVVDAQRQEEKGGGMRRG